MTKVVEVWGNGKLQRVFSDKFYDWTIEPQGNIIIVRAKQRQTGEAFNLYVTNGMAVEYEFEDKSRGDGK